MRGEGIETQSGTWEDQDYHEYQTIGYNNYFLLWNVLQLSAQKINMNLVFWWRYTYQWFWLVTSDKSLLLLTATN